MEKRDSFFLSRKKEHKFTLNKTSDVTGQHAKKNDVKKAPKPNADATEKKPFDKKTYRLKKYSKKYKLDQWEEQRKKKALREYYKDSNKDPMIGSYKPINYDELDAEQQVGKYVRHPDLIKAESAANGTNESKDNSNKRDPYKKAKERFETIKQAKINKQLEKEKAKEESNKKLQEYKKKKQERFKKLSRKTKKGQPVMTGRLELLLEKIQQSK